MNERIRELAEQSCFDDVGKDYSLYFNLTKNKVEKFADLIILEVVQHLTNKGLDHAREVVEKEFGVSQ